MSMYKVLYKNKFYKQDMSYAENADYLFMLYAPKEYEVEKEILEYWEKHPNATVRDLLIYFNNIVPDGLSPNDDGLDLLEE